MKNKENVPHNDYSVDEILAEAKIQKDQKTEPAPKKDTAEPSRRSRNVPFDADGIVRSAHAALDMETADEPSAPPEKKPARKKKHSFFRRKEEEEDGGSVPEDDIYYGLQLKSLKEYRQEYEETIRLDPQPFRDAEAALRKKREEADRLMPENRPEALSAQEESLPVEQAAEPVPEDRPEALSAQEESFPVEQTAEPLSGPSAETGMSEPAVSASTEDRQDILEKIMRQAGLDTEDMFGPENSIPKPEFPVTPPHSPPPPAAPPVSPVVEPGPPLEPEQEPPMQEPPPEPSPELTGKGMETEPTEGEPESVPEKTAATKPESTGETVPQKAKISEQPEKKSPSGIREPVVTPREKDETPPPPAAKDPPQKEIPRYRADSLPLHIIELNAFDDALTAEASAYDPPPIHAPEPIPFPAAREEEKQETVPEKTGDVHPVPLPERPPETQKAKKRFRVFGNEEDPAPPDHPAEEPQEELDDYDDPADAPSVWNDLSSNVRKLFLRFAVTCLFTILAAGFAVAWEHPSLLPAGLHKAYTAQNCLIVQLVLLIVSAVFCAPTILNGLRGLFRLQANSESAVAVAVLAAAAQNAVFIFTGFPPNCRIYSSLAILALFLDTAGKLSLSKRILRNFRFITSPDEKYAVQTFDDYNTAIQMTKAFAADGPKISYQTKAGFLSHFLSHSYASDPGEHVSQFLAPAGFLGSLVLCIVAAVLTKDPSAALTAFTAATCLCVPFGGPLSVNLPLARLNRIAARCGGMTVGWDAIERFSDTDAVMLNAQDLFPRGTVLLNGIQTFAGQRIDEAILDATALTAAVGGTLSDLFSQIVKTRGEVLPHVERPVYEEGLGIAGTVSDRIILVGRGELLKRHGIDAPSHDYEEKYLRSGKIPVYLASGGQLVAMFLVFYRSDRRRAAELRRLENNGIGLLVRTLDPNITPELISDCFGLSCHSVTVLPERLGEVYDSLQAHPPKRTPAVLATKGRVSAMMRLLTACSRQRGNITIGVALQTAGAALGFALAAFFTACSGLSQLSATVLLLFEVFWTAAVIFIPKIRRP